MTDEERIVDFRARLQLRLEAAAASIPLTEAGQAIVMAEIEAQLTETFAETLTFADSFNLVIESLHDVGYGHPSSCCCERCTQ